MTVIAQYGGQTSTHVHEALASLARQELGGAIFFTQGKPYVKGKYVGAPYRIALLERKSSNVCLLVS